MPKASLWDKRFLPQIYSIFHKKKHDKSETVVFLHASGDARAGQEPCPFLAKTFAIAAFAVMLSGWTDIFYRLALIICRRTLIIRQRTLIIRRRTLIIRRRMLIIRRRTLIIWRRTLIICRLALIFSRLVLTDRKKAMKNRTGGHEKDLPVIMDYTITMLQHIFRAFVQSRAIHCMAQMLTGIKAINTHKGCFNYNAGSN